MWPQGFDPEHLTRDASLNKLVIRRVPGAQAAHVGRNGADLLGRDAVMAVVRERCGVDVPPDAVADWLGASLAGDPTGGATGVVDEVGDRLASLIATLRDPGTADAATGGRRTYLAVWPTLEEVILGGGLLKGAVGERVAARVRSVLPAGPVVRAARYPEWLALVGAARSASDADAEVVVLDGGQSSIKRGIVVFKDQRLVGLRVFPPVPVTAVSGPGLSNVVAAAARS